MLLQDSHSLNKELTDKLNSKAGNNSNIHLLPHCCQH
jgi:hypothetical protein